jgi:predicted nucleic acid-binding protein
MTHVANAYFVDTGIFVRWYIEQIGFEHALDIHTEFLNGRVVLETADCVRFELAHVLNKKGYQPGKLDRDEYLAAVRSLDDLGIVVHATDVDALERAAALAADRNLRFFDALIIDRSIERGLTLLTSDKHLCNAVAGFARTELLKGIP